MLKRVFGPVPSRRLGQSLGIDPVPLKTCNWNCVYCQLGRTQNFFSKRHSFFEVGEVLEQVQEALQSHQPGEIDWITFVGSGETMLESGIGQMIAAVKDLTDIPIAVITNGSLLYLPEVRAELLLADAVLPSLDAGNPALYRRINRPNPQFSFERLVQGLIDFRKEYQNQLWVEVMLVQGLNDSAEALQEIKRWLEKIQPDEVHIVQPTRPPVETWVKPPDAQALQRAHEILGDVATVVLPAKGSFDLGGEEGLVDAIIGIITRHPMRESELIESLTGWSESEVRHHLEVLSESGEAQVIKRFGERFWSASGAIYPNHQKNIHDKE
jgi:wyosine [tRNA(Phe)-imidazoG37] synthetase (radical SAM superfamily)